MAVSTRNIRQCTAKAKSTGERCLQPAAPGYNVCRFHGGKTPRGVASATYKHGRYSKVLKEGDLAARFSEAQDDPDLLSLRADVALVTARLEGLLDNVDAMAYAERWRQLTTAYTIVREGMMARDTQAVANGMDSLGKIIQDGAKDAAAWPEIYDLLERRRRISDSERRRMIELQQTVTLNEFHHLMLQIAQTVREYVTDAKALHGIQERILQLAGVSGIQQSNGEAGGVIVSGGATEAATGGKP